jgi:hypothetical protein
MVAGSEGAVDGAVSSASAGVAVADTVYIASSPAAVATAAATEWQLALSRVDFVFAAVYENIYRAEQYLSGIRLMIKPSSKIL